MGIDYTDLWVSLCSPMGFYIWGPGCGVLAIWVLGIGVPGLWGIGYRVLGFGYQGFQGPAPQGPGYWVPYGLSLGTDLG